MEYIRITKENIDSEHICCAMSGKQSVQKKDWLKARFDECLSDAQSQNKSVVCILSSAKKKEFLSDPKYLAYKGFIQADVSDCGINLMYLPLSENVISPRFKDCAKHSQIEDKGLVIYYTDQCPFTYYWVNRVA